MINGISTPKTGKVAEAHAKNEALRMRIGWLGAFFGDGQHATVYITGIIVFSCLIIGAVFAFHDKDVRTDYIKAVMALLVAGFGYLAGSKLRSDNDS